MAKHFNIQIIKEFLRIKDDRIRIKVLVSSGRDGEYHVFISPTLLVSGYGSTEEEAKESFKHNMDLFIRDIMALEKQKRNTYLFSLGFQQEKYRRKNFTNIYADKNNVLETLEPSTRTSAVLEAAF
ncbi:hypothetical protein [uncultured Chryseobacterium sp.]|uniref:hypothetical protein n=1 Tax=uncultured Chryseobacterium sp. TaxID=259322 RepID=UPI002584BFB5|nr:hypothetical protein [uncultured Chryseobacterium sp.]